MVCCQMCGQTILPSMPTGIDWQEFSLSLRIAMARENLSLRDLAAKIGIDQATIHRVAKHEKPVRVEAYLSLAAFIQSQHTSQGDR